jgi:hypothetical protein
MFYDKKEVLGKGYLYNLWQGSIREYYGKIVRGYGDDSDRCCFKVLDEHGREMKILLCSSTEGKIYQKSVYLHDRDKKRAAKILIENEEYEIAKIEYKLRNRKEIIETLKKQLEL